MHQTPENYPITMESNVINNIYLCGPLFWLINGGQV